MDNNLYLSRYAYPTRLISNHPRNDTGIIVVIPCYNEPDLTASIKSLYDCTPPNCHVEIIVIINEPENATDDIKKQNQLTFKNIKQWLKENERSDITTYICYEQLPNKTAGVGLARKIGMDEAVRRFDDIQNHNGIILCFDADSTCSSNYLQETIRCFNKNKNILGSSNHFEHPISGDLEDEIYQGIILYELHLRYYNNALRFSGFPYAYQTIGSAMAVRSSAYQKAGGMNKRKAGEDFYFLHKIIPLGLFIEINTSMVIPSPRKSDRVPFGTGKAIGDWLESNQSSMNSYNIQSFKDLKIFFDIAPAFYKAENPESLISKLPMPIQDFIENIDFIKQLNILNKQSSNLSTFIHRWFSLFNGFRILKFVHFARDNYYPNRDITHLAATLLSIQGDSNSDLNNAKDLLIHYRTKDKLARSVKINQKHQYFWSH